MGDVGGGSFFLENKGFTVLLESQEDLKKLRDVVHGSSAGNAGAGSSGNGGGGANNGSNTTSNNSRIINNGITTPPNSTQLPAVRSHVYRVNFEGASDDVQIIPEKVQDSYNNYIIGNDSTKWASNCKIYKGVTYHNMYPGIDVRYYSENGSLKYDIVVSPGANPNNIIMKYDGPRQTVVKNNQLYVKTSVGDVKELEPYSYQFDKGKWLKRKLTANMKL